jgi:RNA polymerase sigma-70 factor (ECF subfamily)
MSLFKEDAQDERAQDEELVLAAQASPQAFAALYDRYLSRIYRFCYNRLGERQAAEDATSEVFLHAYAHLSGYHSGSFAAWLYTIARNVVVGHYRRQRPSAPLAAAEGQPAAASSDPAAGYAERAAVRWALEQLNEEQRTAIELPAAGWSDAQIGEILGKTEAAVRMLRYRALQRLQVLLFDVQSNTAPSETIGVQTSLLPGKRQ